MSSEAHCLTKRVGFDVVAIKSEHLQFCICPHPLKLMESQKSLADVMSDNEGKGLSSSEEEEESNLPSKKEKYW